MKERASGGEKEKDLPVKFPMSFPSSSALLERRDSRGEGERETVVMIGKKKDLICCSFGLIF